MVFQPLSGTSFRQPCVKKLFPEEKYVSCFKVILFITNKYLHSYDSCGKRSAKTEQEYEGKNEDTNSVKGFSKQKLFRK